MNTKYARHVCVAYSFWVDFRRLAPLDCVVQLSWNHEQSLSTDPKSLLRIFAFLSTTYSILLSSVYWLALVNWPVTLAPSHRLVLVLQMDWSTLTEFMVASSIVAILGRLYGGVRLAVRPFVQWSHDCLSAITERDVTMDSGVTHPPVVIPTNLLFCCPKVSCPAVALSRMRSTCSVPTSVLLAIRPLGWCFLGWLSNTAVHIVKLYSGISSLLAM